MNEAEARVRRLYSWPEVAAGLERELYRRARRREAGFAIRRLLRPITGMRSRTRAKEAERRM